MDPEIQKSVRKLFMKFLLLQALVLAAALVLSASFTAYFKQRLAGQLAAASRDALLSGDSRRAMMDLTAAVARDFSGLVWTPAEGDEGFAIPAGAGPSESLLLSAARVRVSFDVEERYHAGNLTFTYPRWMPVLWGALAWLAIFLLSIPVALLERRRLIKDYNLLLELRIKESYGTLAAQVAHDIRSPLAALRSAAAGLNASPEQKALIAGAAGRISGIAEDLLLRYRKPGGEAAGGPEVCRLPDLVEQVVREKRCQYGGRADLKIEFSAPDRNVCAAAGPKELQRLVSNLINNAVEALERGGTVRVEVVSSGKLVLVRVRDDGKGIPPEILGRLGNKGETHGKAGGTGLGLYHARATAESWGGALRIESGPDGTAVTVELPAATPAQPPPGPVVLLDDDQLVHMNWKMAAKAAGAELRAYKTPEELRGAAPGLPKDARIFIDSELGGGQKGEDLAEELHGQGFSDISMATGHAPERFARLGWLKVAGKEPPWEKF